MSENHTDLTWKFGTQKTVKIILVITDWIIIYQMFSYFFNKYALIEEKHIWCV